MENTIYRLVAEEPMKYHIMNDPVKYGFVLLPGEQRRILGSVLSHLKVSKMKGKGKAKYRLERE